MARALRGCGSVEQLDLSLVVLFCEVSPLFIEYLRPNNKLFNNKNACLCLNIVKEVWKRNYRVFFLQRPSIMSMYRKKYKDGYKHCPDFKLK